MPVAVAPIVSAESANIGNNQSALAGLKRKQLHTEKGDTTAVAQKVHQAVNTIYMYTHYDGPISKQFSGF